jgi:hypothetical protein
MLHTCAIGGLQILIQATVEYINIVGALHPCNRWANYFVKNIVEYIYVTRTSCPGNRGIKYLYKVAVEYINVEGVYVPLIVELSVLLKIF